MKNTEQAIFEQAIFDGDQRGFCLTLPGMRMTVEVDLGYDQATDQWVLTERRDAAPDIQVRDRAQYGAWIKMIGHKLGFEVTLEHVGLP